MMNVIYDGLIFQAQTFGGISRLYREMMPRIGELDPAISMTILTTGRCRGELPRHRQISRRALLPVDDILRPHRLWGGFWERARTGVQRRALKSMTGDIWHSTYYTSPGSWGRPIVVTVLDMIHERFPQYFSRSRHERFRLQKEGAVSSADAVICISETTKNDLIHFYHADEMKIRVIPLAPSSAFRKLERIPDHPLALTNEPFLIYVGGRGLYKNFREVVDAYGGWAYRKAVAMAVVGPAWSNEERALLVERDILDRVKLYVDIDDAALCQLYNRAAGLVFPSFYEGFGLPLLEAAACGCPIVASRIPTTLDIMGEDAIYFEPGKVGDLTGALTKAIQEGRDSIRAGRGLEIAERYSWKKTASDTIALYRRLVNNS
jgi:glycosyltransferase involved in cell wall biosynthesis